MGDLVVVTQDQLLQLVAGLKEVVGQEASVDMQRRDNSQQLQNVFRAFRVYQSIKCDMYVFTKAASTFLTQTVYVCYRCS